MSHEYTVVTLMQMADVSACTEALNPEYIEARRRILACWNACAGFDTEMLEYVVKNGETLKQHFEGMQAVRLVDAELQDAIRNQRVDKLNDEINELRQMITKKIIADRNNDSAHLEIACDLLSEVRANNLMKVMSGTDALLHRRIEKFLESQS